METLTSSTVAIFGAGAIGGALIERLLAVGVPASRIRAVESFLRTLGDSPEVADARMNRYTALTAVGPTYFHPVFDALIAAGTAAGLSREDALAAAIGVARGTADLVAQRRECAGDLRLITGLRPLDHDQARDLVAAVIAAALARMNDVERTIESGPR